MREFSILIRRETGLEGQWVAHCLNWDLVSQGDTPEHAARMIAEAILVALVEDTREGLDADDRPAAPRELWKIFERTQQRGKRIAADDVNALAAKSGDVVIATVLYMQPVRAGGSVRAEDATASAPPPFVIAALGNDHAPL